MDERMPVWNALSELFLDTELEAADHERIAGVLRDSPYSRKEIDDILRHEVHPACAANLQSVAGQWGCFSEAWIIENIAPRRGKRSLFNHVQPVRRVYAEDWAAVEQFLGG